MKKMLLTCIVTSAVVLIGCVSAPKSEPITIPDIKPITYDYVIDNTSKDILWKRARNYLATVYGDSKSVIRVEDQGQGVIIGKGIVNWKIINQTYSPNCNSNYDIRFMAKENKARLQLELIEGVPPASKCTGWVLPSSFGYTQVEESFKNISEGLENALKGNGAIESLSDF